MNAGKHSWENYRVPSQVRTYEPLDVPFGPVNLIGRNRLPGTVVQHMSSGIYVIRKREDRLVLCGISDGETIANLSDVGTGRLFAIGAQTLGKTEN